MHIKGLELFSKDEFVYTFHLDLEKVPVALA